MFLSLRYYSLHQRLNQILSIFGYIHYSYVDIYICLMQVTQVQSLWEAILKIINPTRTAASGVITFLPNSMTSSLFYELLFLEMCPNLVPIKLNS